MWSKLHALTFIPTIIIFIIAAIILRIHLKNASESKKLLPLKIISILILALEVLKQVYSLATGYSLYFIPLHYCSMFILALPLASFYNGKYKQEVRNITAALTTSLSLFMLVGPTVVYPPGSISAFFKDVISFHTVSYHNLVVFYSILALALNTVECNPKKNWKYLLYTLLIFCAVSSSAANLLQTNYTNFLRCTVPVLENAHQSLINTFGYSVGHLMYIMCVASSTIAVTFFSYFVFYYVNSLINSKKTQYIDSSK